MKILIDITNSPHVLFFKPIILELKKRGHIIDIIARDHAQTKPLLDIFGMKYTLIGKHVGKGKFRKLAHAISRVLQIAKYIKQKNQIFAYPINLLMLFMLLF